MGADMVELKQSDRTVELIRKYLSDMGLNLPLESEDMDVISDFFENMEVDMANGLSEGVETDRNLLEDISNAYDEVTYVDDDDFIDMSKLNRRLMN